PPVLLAPEAALLDANRAARIRDVHAIGERAGKTKLSLALVGQSKVDVSNWTQSLGWLGLALQVVGQRSLVCHLSARNDVCEGKHRYVSLLGDGSQDAAQKIGVEHRERIAAEPRHQVVGQALAGEAARPGRLDVGDQLGALV